MNQHSIGIHSVYWMSKIIFAISICCSSIYLKQISPKYIYQVTNMDFDTFNYPTGFPYQFFHATNNIKNILKLFFSFSHTLQQNEKFLIKKFLWGKTLLKKHSNNEKTFLHFPRDISLKNVYSNNTVRRESEGPFEEDFFLFYSSFHLNLISQENFLFFSYIHIYLFWCTWRATKNI